MPFSHISAAAIWNRRASRVQSGVLKYLHRWVIVSPLYAEPRPNSPQQAGFCMAYFVRVVGHTHADCDIQPRGVTKMNWELSGACKHKCPCGQGTYTIRTFLDDWKRPEEQWDMDCPKCRRKYDLCSIATPKSGRLLRTNRWVKRSDPGDESLSLARTATAQGGGEWGKRLEGARARGIELQSPRNRSLRDRL